LRRFFDGLWWGWDGTTWIYDTEPMCSWGSALVSPSADLLDEAHRQLLAQGAPVIETWSDGNTYLFSYDASGAVAIYPCVGGLSGVPADRPFG
jgi:hypothetical protein